MQISDFLVEKYKALLYLMKHQSFEKGLLQFFVDSREGRYLTEETHNKNIPPGNMCIIKTNVRQQQKAIFFIKKNIYLCNLISSCSEDF